MCIESRATSLKVFVSSSINFDVTIYQVEMEILYICMYVCMYVCMHACMYVCVCMYVCMYACMYVCMYIFCWFQVTAGLMTDNNNPKSAMVMLI